MFLVVNSFRADIDRVAAEGNNTVLFARRKRKLISQLHRNVTNEGVIIAADNLAVALVMLIGPTIAMVLQVTPL